MAVEHPRHQGAKLLTSADRHKVTVFILRPVNPTVGATGRSIHRKEGAPIPIDNDGVGNIVAAAARPEPWPIIAAATIVSSTGRLRGSSWERVFIAAFIKEVRNTIARRPPGPLGRGQTTP